MRKQSKWRRAGVAALIGVGLALVGGGFAFMTPNDGTWTADGTWTQSVRVVTDSPVVSPLDGTWTQSVPAVTDGPVITPLDGTWTN
jgi:hypothetical protein